MGRSAARRGFTLIELVVTIVIVGILAAVGVAGYQQVVGQSATEAAETQLRELGRSTSALARPQNRFDAQTLQRTGTEFPSLALTSSSATAEREVSYALSASGRSLGLAMRAGEECVRIHVQLEGIERASGAGECIATLPPEESPSPTPTASSGPEALTPPQNLRGTRGDRSLRLEWDAASIAGARYYLERDGEALGVTAETTHTSTGLAYGQNYRFSVYTLAPDGRRSLPSQIELEARPEGVWDAALTWAYANDTVCFGGSSSWTWNLRVAVTPGTEARYRVRIHTLNETAPGADPWVEVDLTALEPGLAHVFDEADRRVCAPDGNPVPPFTKVEILEAATGEPAVIQKVSEFELPSSRITHTADGEPAPVPEGITP